MVDKDCEEFDEKLKQMREDIKSLKTEFGFMISGD